MKSIVHYPYITFTIDAPISIYEFFSEFHLSKKTIHLLKQNKDYTVNKRFVSSSTILIKGDHFTVKAFQQDDGMYPPVYEPLDIIYEDEFILVVNKPAFMNVFPDDQSKTDSLANIVSGYYQQSGYDIPVRYIHRLDYETSGLVLFCKCAFIQPLLDYQLSIKEIKRHYFAIVEGTFMNHKVYSIRKPIGHDRHHNQKMIVTARGKDACTYYQCISTNKQISLIDCSLETGRKHQIRVHMAYIGHPLVGDKLYGKESDMINRQALHAYQLDFIHPITKEKTILVSHPPMDIRNIIQEIEKSNGQLKWYL